MKLSWTEKILLNKWGDSKNLFWADQRPYEKLQCPGRLLKTREYFDAKKLHKFLIKISNVI